MCNRAELRSFLILADVMIGWRKRSTTFVHWCCISYASLCTVLRRFPMENTRGSRIQGLTSNLPLTVIGRMYPSIRMVLTVRL